MRVHYPRTPHLPWSPGASSDDVRVGDLSGLAGREVVVTEKLDGENTTLYADGLHARSLDSAHHPSRAWVKALQGRIGPAIPQGGGCAGRTCTRGTGSTLWYNAGVLVLAVLLTPFLPRAAQSPKNTPEPAPESDRMVTFLIAERGTDAHRPGPGTSAASLRCNTRRVGVETCNPRALPVAYMQHYMRAT